METHMNHFKYLIPTFRLVELVTQNFIVYLLFNTCMNKNVVVIEQESLISNPSPTETIKSFVLCTKLVIPHICRKKYEKIIIFLKATLRLFLNRPQCNINHGGSSPRSAFHWQPNHYFETLCLFYKWPFTLYALFYY